MPPPKKKRFKNCSRKSRDLNLSIIPCLIDAWISTNFNCVIFHIYLLESSFFFFYLFYYFHFISLWKCPLFRKKMKKKEKIFEKKVRSTFPIRTLLRSFQLPMPNLKCSFCNRARQCADNCPSRLTCGSCREVGHEKADCPTMSWCDHHQKYGHKTADCRMSAVCKHCGVKGRHFSHECLTLPCKSSTALVIGRPLARRSSTVSAAASLVIRPSVAELVSSASAGVTLRRSASSVRTVRRSVISGKSVSCRLRTGVTFARSTITRRSVRLCRITGASAATRWVTI